MSKKNVYVLVNNDCAADARVLKETEVIAKLGYNAIIFARSHPEQPEIETRNGFEIRRFPIRHFGAEAPFCEEALSAFAGVRDEMHRRLTLDWNEEAKKYEKPWHERTGKRELLRLTERYFYAEALLKQAITERPAYIHCHDIETLAAGVALSRRIGGKVIYDAHELEYDRNPPMSKDAKSMVISTENELFRSVGHMITCSDSIAKEYAKRLRSRPTVVFNTPKAVDIDRESVPKLRERIGLGEKTPLLVYTGHVMKTGRGLVPAIKALRGMPGAHFAIMGPRLNRDEWLLSVAEENGVRDRVHLLAPVEHYEVPEAISDADVAICNIEPVSLSYRFSMPNKLFEAALARIPICASDFTDMRKFVKKFGIGEVVNPSDPSDIARCIRTLLENREKYVFSDEARQLFEREYSWAAQTEKVRSVYFWGRFGWAPQVASNIWRSNSRRYLKPVLKRIGLIPA